MALIGTLPLNASSTIRCIRPALDHLMNTHQGLALDIWQDMLTDAIMIGAVYKINKTPIMDVLLTRQDMDDPNGWSTKANDKIDQIVNQIMGIQTEASTTGLSEYEEALAGQEIINEIETG